MINYELLYGDESTKQKGNVSFYFHANQLHQLMEEEEEKGHDQNQRKQYDLSKTFYA